MFVFCNLNCYCYQLEKKKKNITYDTLSKYNDKTTTFSFREDDEPRPAPKIRLREVMSAMMDVVQRGGQEAVRLRKEGKIREYLLLDFYLGGTLDNVYWFKTLGTFINLDWLYLVSKLFFYKGVILFIIIKFADQ